MWDAIMVILRTRFVLVCTDTGPLKDAQRRKESLQDSEQFLRISSVTTTEIRAYFDTFHKN